VEGYGGNTRRKEMTKRPRHRYENNIKMDLRDIGWTRLIRLRLGTSGGLL
jgi:hypothetical protein